MRICRWMLSALWPMAAQDFGDAFTRMGWIAGGWSGPVGRATTEEHWIPPSGNAMLGVSRTIAGTRMVAFEYLRIIRKADGAFYYVAQPNGRPPTEFKLTKLSDHEAVFENPRHDHPKIISYRLDGDTLVAKIEGDEGGKPKVQEFRLKKTSPVR